MLQKNRRAGNLLRSGVTAISALLATAGAATAGAGPAAAAPADFSCTSVQAVCLWDQAGYSGTRFTVQASKPASGTCVDLAAHGWGAGLGKSARNTGSQKARLYGTQNCTGSWYMIVPGGSYESIDFASNSIYVY